MNKITKVLLYIAKGLTLVFLYSIGVLSFATIFIWHILDKTLTAINNKLNVNEYEREDD